jgi:hypothetical protein
MSQMDRETLIAVREQVTQIPFTTFEFFVESLLEWLDVQIALAPSAEPYFSPEWVEGALTQHVRSMGCKCATPLLGYTPNVGPRCRLCGAEPNALASSAEPGPVVDTPPMPSTQAEWAAHWAFYRHAIAQRDGAWRELEGRKFSEAQPPAPVGPTTDEPSPLWQHAVNECNEAHVILDMLGAPKTQTMRRVRGPDGDEDVSLGLAARIVALRFGRPALADFHRMMGLDQPSPGPTPGVEP